MGLTKRRLMERYPQSNEDYIPPRINYFRCQNPECKMAWRIKLMDCCEESTETRDRVKYPYCKCPSLRVESAL
jgi:hypothetical protein